LHSYIAKKAEEYWREKFFDKNSILDDEKAKLIKIFQDPENCKNVTLNWIIDLFKSIRILCGQIVRKMEMETYKDIERFFNLFVLDFIKNKISKSKSDSAQNLEESKSCKRILTI